MWVIDFEKNPVLWNIPLSFVSVIEILDCGINSAGFALINGDFIEFCKIYIKLKHKFSVLI